MAKRFFDIVAAIIGLILLCPVLFWIAWRIKAEDGGPVFYRGVRVGLHEKPFRIFEAIYYLPDAEQFVRECVRVLRPGGKVLIASANKDLYDFNSSPHSYKYYGVVELWELFVKSGFETEFFGDTPVGDVSIRQRVLRPIKKLVVMLGLMPKTTVGKKWLKRIVFGNLVEMPAEIEENTARYVEPDRISATEPDRMHKVIYCVATLE